ncbi:MAG: hypothetical protein RR977_04320, partial [Oscillospiraceae bacterium]
LTMQKCMRFFKKFSFICSAVSVVTLALILIFKKVLPIKCSSTNYAQQKAETCIIGGADGPTAIFVSNRCHPGWIFKIPFFLGVGALLSDLLGRAFSTFTFAEKD